MAYYLVILFCLLSSSYAILYPSQIHLSYTQNPQEMRVTWSLYPFVIESNLHYREILCESSERNKWKSLKPKSNRFRHGDMVYEYQFIQTAVIPYLKHACYYEYKISNSVFTTQAYIFSGRTPYSSSSFDYDDLNYQPTLLIIGDMGVGNWSEPTRTLINKEAELGTFDAIVHLGDIAYDLDSKGGSVGNAYGKQIQDFTAIYPYMTLPGNHERAGNFTHYSNRYLMPENWASQNTSLYYSFNLGRAHFIFYNTELFFYGEVQQQDLMIQWLIEDLTEANQNREDIPWIVVMSHKPLYCSTDPKYSWDDSDHSNNINCYKQSKFTRSKVEEIFYSHKVDLIISAHVHNYERDSAIYQNRTFPSEYEDFHTHHNPTAPVHILSGIAGNDHGYESLPDSKQEWFKYGSIVYGYGKLTVLNSTHIYWEQNDVIKEEMIDYVWISKDRQTY